ncbi:hypothetical protein P7K49_001953 [Saguinus oedipus]|uniref:Uncharacterized protein n=1 Tax=Saguinus oedipus TaxID=9490 RepID=A0ABQ9WFX7_SAGOE|nr:hypothetical protein P7K49_001953 [Saguinus oedipus]
MPYMHLSGPAFGAAVVLTHPGGSGPTVCSVRRGVRRGRSASFQSLGGRGPPETPPGPSPGTRRGRQGRLSAPSIQLPGGAGPEQKPSPQPTPERLPSRAASGISPPGTAPLARTPGPPSRTLRAPGRPIFPPLRPLASSPTSPAPTQAAGVDALRGSGGGAWGRGQCLHGSAAGLASRAQRPGRRLRRARAIDRSRPEWELEEEKKGLEEEGLDGEGLGEEEELGEEVELEEEGLDGEGLGEEEELGEEVELEEEGLDGEGLGEEEELGEEVELEEEGLDERAKKVGTGRERDLEELEEEEEEEEWGATILSVRPRWAL